MENEDLKKLQSQFDRMAQVFPDAKVEFWYARDLQAAFDYDRWENFKKVLQKGMLACQTANFLISDHFREVTKMAKIGQNAERAVEDFMLTRYACYLVAQNGDARKVPIAFAQSYFALQTRKQELIQERVKLEERIKARQKLKESEADLSRNIYQRGIDDRGFGRIRSKGDASLFGGLSTQAMKGKLGILDSKPLADFLPTITIAAKNLATEITNHNVTRHNLKGERPITQEHVQNNKSVRNTLVQRGIQPETLPAEEDIKKLERRVQTEAKKFGEKTTLPKHARD